ncbi:hypothetical protein I0E98_16360 [Pseudomonas lalucatii]|nr:hypothetical protein [Pseudomonas lalucatii]
MTTLTRLGAALALLLLSASILAEARLEVRVQPANKALKSNIEGHIGSLGERDPESLQRFRRVAESQARKAAQALGYYQARITSEVVAGEPHRLIIGVDPGEPVRLREVILRVEGPAERLEAFRLPREAQLRSGAVLNHGRYDAAKRHIQNQASRYGFFSGRFSRQRLRIDPDAGVADVELVYASGPRYRLGAVSFSGDAPFDQELLGRMVPFAADSPYDSELIAELYQAMRSSGYFESVRVDANPATAEAEAIPVEVQLQVRKPRSLGLGLGVPPTSGCAAGPTGHATGPTPRGTATGWRWSCRSRGRTSACGTTCRSTRR